MKVKKEILSQWRISCREEVREVEIDNLSKEEWEDFLNSYIWKYLSFELEERDKILMSYLRNGDKVWSDEEIRARISELEYVKGLPKAIILDLTLAEEGKTEKGEG